MDKSKDKKPSFPDIAALSFEEALAELEKLVRRLEDGKAGLDDAMAAYERGSLLKKHCEIKLRAVQARIEKISFESGGVSTTPFDA